MNTTTQRDDECRCSDHVAHLRDHMAFIERQVAEWERAGDPAVAQRYREGARAVRERIAGLERGGKA